MDLIRRPGPLRAVWMSGLRATQDLSWLGAAGRKPVVASAEGGGAGESRIHLGPPDGPERKVVQDRPPVVLQ